MPRYGANSYREIRGVLAPEYRDLPDESVEALVQSSLGAVDTEALESFLSSSKKFGGMLAKAAPSVLPMVGTVAGTAFGGPLGATVGGALGRAAGGAIGGAAAAGGGGGGRGRASRRSFMRSARALGKQAAALAPGLAGAGGQGSPAAQQLLSIINRPEIIQALMAMALGSAGRTHIPVGGGEPDAPGEPAEPPVPVPVGAFANVIGSLANQAGSDLNAAEPQQGESVPSYLLGEGGEFLVDPAVPEERARLVLELLHGSLPESDEADDEWASFEDYEDEDDEDEVEDNYYDMLELSEAYADEY
jgi:hypothetical protein